MLLPADFTSRIADTFYDKQVTKLVKSETSDDGWVETVTVDGDTFYANVQFSNLGIVQSELGLTEQIDVVMTCLPTTEMEAGDLFEYGGVKYIATKAIPFDSHKKIVGVKWA